MVCHPRAPSSVQLDLRAGLVELLQDDRAALYGALLQLADLFNSEKGENAKALARRRGKRAFEAEVSGPT